MNCRGLAAIPLLLGMVGACTDNRIVLKNGHGLLKKDAANVLAAEGGPTPIPAELKLPHDYLFVADNSSSAQKLMTHFVEMVATLPSGTYPADTRFAVMSSMVADYTDFTKPNKAISDLIFGLDGKPTTVRYLGLAGEPGFLNLVNAAAVKRFLDQAELVSGDGRIETIYRNAYSKAACDGEWFRPTDKNTTGDLCLAAALQSPHHSVTCEAGLNAFEQFMTAAKKASRKVFRSGARIHVVFISDEPHPGCADADLIAKIPTFSALNDLIVADANPSAFFIHGIGVDPVESSALTGDEARFGTYAVSVRKRVKEAGGVYVSVRDSATEAQQLAKVLTGFW